MPRIHFFEDGKIVIYMFDESGASHHLKHIMVATPEQNYNYDFVGEPIKCDKIPKYHAMISEWILEHRDELEENWYLLSIGKAPKYIK